MLRAFLVSLAILWCGSSQAGSWSPDGSMIAFSYIGGPENLYLVETDGTGLRELVVREQRDFQPEWAPDGSHLVFTSVVEGKHVMMRVSADGTGLERISEPADAEGDPDYSPDGTQILYFTDEPKPRELFIREVDSEKVRQVTETPDFDEMSPRWAPDGQHVLFVGKARETGVESDVWSLDIATGVRRNLTNSPGIGEFHADWSNDGKRIVYIRVESGAFDVAVRDITTGAETIVASGNGFAVLSPHFSPDDSQIAFTRTDFEEKGSGMPALVVVKLLDGSERKLAQGRYLSESARLNP